MRARLVWPLALRLSALRICALALFALASLACATTGRSSGATPKPPLDDAAEVKIAAQIAAARPHFVVRYNPTACTCPTFEIQLGARWVRLQLEDLDAPGSLAARLLTRAKADLKAGRIPHYPVYGDLSTSPDRCARGALFLSISLSAPPAPKVPPGA